MSATYEFPESAITYFHFIPDIYDNVFVQQDQWYFAAIAVDGYVAIDRETGEPSPEYTFQPIFKPHVIKLQKPAYQQIMELVEGMHDPFNPINAVCIGIMHRCGATSLVPFLAHDRDADGPARTNLVERRSEEALLKAISEASSLLPAPLQPRDRKCRTDEDGKLPLKKTQLLHTLLDRCNELSMDQLEELVRIVAAASDGRYVIKLRPADMWLPHIKQKEAPTGG